MSGKTTDYCVPPRISILLVVFVIKNRFSLFSEDTVSSWKQIELKEEKKVKKSTIDTRAGRADGSELVPSRVGASRGPDAEIWV